MPPTEQDLKMRTIERFAQELVSSRLPQMLHFDALVYPRDDRTDFDRAFDELLAAQVQEQNAWERERAAAQIGYRVGLKVGLALAGGGR